MLRSPVSVPVKDVTEILVSVSPMNDFLDEAVIVTKILIGILVGWYL